MFASNLAKEEAYPDTRWVESLAKEEMAFFGLYLGEEIVGLTGIILNSHVPGEAVMIASYIREEHRGKGLSDLLDRVRIDWARDKGLTHLTVGHRASNEASRRANQRFGFQYTFTESREWPDGEVEDNLNYRLEL